MKKLLFTLAAVAISGWMFAQTPVVTGPAIQVDKDVHNYGNVPYGGNGTCEFKVTNTGTEPLILSKCKGSCGCTVPQCPKEPILPGKSGIIKVKYDTQRVGGIYKTVTVNSNAKSGVQTLTIKGNIDAKPVEEAFPQNPTPQGAPVEKKG